MVSIRLGRIESNDPLPAWTPGAHIDVYVPDGTTRQYSLCGDPGDLSSYQIAVLREPESRGGSSYLHDQLRVGDRLLVTRPEAPLRPRGRVLPRPGRRRHRDHPDHGDGRGAGARRGGRTQPDLRRADARTRWPSAAAGRAGRPGHAPGRGHRRAPGPRRDRQAPAGRAGWSTCAVRCRCCARWRRPPRRRTGRTRTSSASSCSPGPGWRSPSGSRGARRRRPTSWCWPSPGTRCGSSRTRTSSTSCSRWASRSRTTAATGSAARASRRCSSGTVEHRDLVLTKKEQAAMDQMLICCSRPTCDAAGAGALTRGLARPTAGQRRACRPAPPHADARPAGPAQQDHRTQADQEHPPGVGEHRHPDQDQHQREQRRA